MTEGYLTAAGFGRGEYEEKKSRFIAHVKPVETEEQVRDFVAEIRRAHPDASHNVWACVLRAGGLLRWSDDGEPGGTSGQPTLAVLRGEGLTDVCCVTTRYFGGTLLGSGGLVRAYSAAARAGLAAAGAVRMTPWRLGALACSYGQYERLRRFLEDRGARVEEASFAETVELVFSAPAGQAESLAEALVNAAAGSVEPRLGKEVFRPTPV